MCQRWNELEFKFFRKTPPKAKYLNDAHKVSKKQQDFSNFNYWFIILLRSGQLFQ